jgi:hypothetical protein
MRKLLAVLLFAALPAFGQGFFRTQTFPITEFHPGWTYSAPVEAVLGEDGFVRLRGILNGRMEGKPYAWWVFQLPPRLRPEYPEYFVVAADGGQAAINITTDGTVWVATNSSLWVTLSGISYKAR